TQRNTNASIRRRRAAGKSSTAESRSKLDVDLLRAQQPTRDGSSLSQIIDEATRTRNFMLTWTHSGRDSPRSITRGNCLLQKIRVFRDFRVPVQHFYTNGDSNDRRTFDAMLRRLRIDYNRSCPTCHPAGI